MDEESFISQFSVRVEVEVILSPRHLDQEVVGIHSSLTDTDWTSKVTGFQTVRGLVNASASFADQFVEKLKYIETPMLTCLKDLRSQVYDQFKLSFWPNSISLIRSLESAV